IRGVAGRDTQGRQIAGGGIWYGTGNAKNMAFKLPENQPQSSKSAEITAALLVTQQTDRDQPLVLHSSSGTVYSEMTRQLQSKEDKGWIGVPERDLLRVLAAELKARTATTRFEIDGTQSDKEGQRELSSLAREGRVAEEILLNLGIDPLYELKGAKLVKLTQALAYAGIKERKEPPARKAARSNTDTVGQ
ncbi:hypothetical protein B0H16DRAFT_1314178, partial [Mycena metata]